ncbi:hypothetical protein GR268_48135, partial [Rhizobium leguminosarum]|nr:hypothetical protein [Rhizobium leguminosarum]
VTTLFFIAIIVTASVPDATTQAHDVTIVDRRPSPTSRPPAREAAQSELWQPLFAQVAQITQVAQEHVQEGQRAASNLIVAHRTRCFFCLPWTDKAGNRVGDFQPFSSPQRTLNVEQKKRSALLFSVSPPPN